MMDCLSAQRIISETLDRAHHPDDVLADAKQHCRDCRECAAFVRTLLVVSRSPVPEPPDDFAERVMERIGREAPAASRAVATDIAPGESHRAQSPLLEATLDDFDVAAVLRSQPDTNASRPSDAQTVVRRLWKPENRRATTAWVSAAAITLIVAGWGAIVGVRQMLMPPPSAQYSFEGAAESGAPQEDASVSRDSAAGTLLATETVTAQPKLIVIDDIVYRFVGMAAEETDESSLQAIGTVATSLDTGRGPRGYRVYQAAAPERVFLDAGADLYEFERVWLTYEGAMYLLKSEPIPAFGQWPSWPQTIAKPRTETGAPSLREAGTAEGTRVFVPRNSGVRGVALPPQPPAPQAIAGCPEWTWWEPLGP